MTDDTRQITVRIPAALWHDVEETSRRGRDETLNDAILSLIELGVRARRRRAALERIAALHATLRVSEDSTPYIRALRGGDRT